MHERRNSYVSFVTCYLTEIKVGSDILHQTCTILTLKFPTRILITFGMELLRIFRIVVVVRTEVIPSVTLAAVDSRGIQNEIQDKTTIRADGE